MKPRSHLAVRPIRLARATLAALALLAPSGARAAGDHGFQLEFRGVGSQPIGKYYSYGVNASDVVGFGGNASGRALVGLNRRYSIGVDFAYLKNAKDIMADVDPRPFVTRLASVRNTLVAIPVDLLIERRTDTHQRVSGYLQSGFGITTFQRRVTGPFPPFTRTQQALSWMVGLGTQVGMGRDFEVVAGADYRQSVTTPGDIWTTWDNPKYVVWSLGMRYPRW